MLGKIIGGAFKAIGLKKLAPIVSMGVNLFTGNVAGLAMDVMGLMSSIKGLGFMNRLAQFAPLGNFGKFDAFASLGRLDRLSDALKPERLRDITRDFSRLADAAKEFRTSAKRIQDMMAVLEETFDNQLIIRNARDHAYYSGSSRLNA
jgi:hypothetical protein